MKTIMKQHWEIGSTSFRLGVGDLFDVPVDAIVNSEQSDFKLSSIPSTISGQINSRYGRTVQPELDAQAKHEVFPPGIVLRTGAAGPYACIYHAGFHGPDGWLPASPFAQLFAGESVEEPEYADIIRTCVREILSDAVERKLASIAFPALGTGLFGLDRSVLGYEFMRAVTDFAKALPGAHRIAVWLVIPPEADTSELVQAMVQAMLDRLMGTPLLDGFSIGVDYLDEFAVTQVKSSDPRYAALQLTRYAELLTGFMMYLLAAASSPLKLPADLLDYGQSLTFGWARQNAQHLALQLERDATLGGWPAYCAGRILKDKRGPKRLLEINDDRNALAHGLNARSAEEIAQDIRAFVDLERWNALKSEIGPPPVVGLAPWIRVDASRSGAPIGVLQRWKGDRADYLNPVSGEMFGASLSAGERL